MEIRHRINSGHRTADQLDFEETNDVKLPEDYLSLYHESYGLIAFWNDEGAIRLVSF